MLPNSEWILLALLAVVLLKPEDIPVVARFLAKAIKQAQTLWNDLIIDEVKKYTDSEYVESTPKKHPFHAAPSKAKSQPVKD